jgi:hypothetical protein
MITLNKILPVNVWNDKKHLTHIELDSDKKDFNVNYRKDSGLYKGYKVIELKSGKEILDVRFYCPTGRANYCAMWIYSEVFASRGTGRACGYGYNRESAAFNEAICNCGIKNFPCFSGSGCNDWAIKILMQILGIKKYKIVEFFA